MDKYIITFGQIHVHNIGGKLLHKNNVAVIKAENLSEAHNKAMTAFNGVFHQCIPEGTFDAEGDIKYFPDGKVEIDI